LARQFPNSTRLRKLRRSLENIVKPEPESGRRYAYLAGLGAQTNTAQLQWSHVVSKAIEAGRKQDLRRLIDYTSLAKILPGTGVATLMFGCLSPTVTQSDVDVLVDLMLRPSEKRTTDFFAELATGQPLRSSVQPWRQGYDLAKSVLTRVRQRFQLPIPIDELFSDFGVPIHRIELLDHTIRAISVAQYEDSAAFVAINDTCPQNAKEPGQRFTLAHELAHLLFDRGSGAKMGVASGPWAPPEIEKRANAFAAMLLMPPELLDKVKPKVWTRSSVEAVARELQCSYRATLEHLVNLRYISSLELQSIEEEP
jgi:Zn-dependent peptidase ImmA (M78 family)